MELKAGYKQTEVGVLPEDWKVNPLSVFADVKTGPFGSALHERDYVSDGTPIITVEHLSEQGVIRENLPLVSDSDRNRLSSYLLRAGDIVFSRVGSVDRNALIRDSESGWLFSGRLLRVRVLRCDVHAPYLSFHFHSEAFRQRVRTVAVGQTMASLNTQILKGVYAVLPSEEEQRAIATALSDVDALLNGLDRLIAKKRDIKQATMQQLISGKTRLPGFEGTWEVKPLEKIVDIRSGGTPSTTNQVFWNGGVPWCTPTDITALHGHKYLIESERTISQKGLQASSAEVIPPNSIIMTTRATIGECAINKIPMATNQGFKNLIPLETDNEFLFYLMTTQKQRLIQLCGGSTFLEVGKKQLQTFEVTLPTDIDEQTAIAAVLSDMDAEIAALEQRLRKTKDIKQAMMQELLTGKTRLI